jgi:hypothetical protein
MNWCAMNSSLSVTSRKACIGRCVATGVRSVVPVRTSRRQVSVKAFKITLKTPDGDKEFE